MKKMESTKEKEKIWCGVLRLYQNNVNVATFTTSLYVTLNITNTPAIRKGQQRNINSSNNKNN